MTGKLADTVMSVRNGQQIARKYQPVVFNPSTNAQVAQRAKMKLMSQLSAALAPAIAIEREGSVSARNIFVKRNFALATYTNDKANVNLPYVQLTNSAIGMPYINAARSEGQISVSIDQSASLAYGVLDADEVVYVLLAKNFDNKLRLAGMKKVAKTESPAFATTFADVANEVVVYAYSIRYNSETARVKYGNMTGDAAETIAKLLVSRAISSQDVTLSETVSAIVAAPQASNQPSPDDNNRSSKKK